MAASKDKASALKNSYVDGIIDELGGASDPAVRMSLRENDQASVHSFPAEGKTGAINDGDPNLYIHGGGKSYEADTDSKYANPIPGQGPGQRILIDSDQDAIDGGQNYLNEMEGRMGGSGDLARARPKSEEDYKRKPQLLGSADRFAGVNLPGVMGMEQGQQATNMFNVTKRTQHSRNDGIPQIVITDDYGNSKKINTGSYKDAYPMNGNNIDPNHWYTRPTGNALNNTLKDMMY